MNSTRLAGLAVLASLMFTPMASAADATPKRLKRAES
jgi:hypothetical protein